VAQAKKDKELHENDQALKHLFGAEILKRIAHAISAHHSTFDRKHFLQLMPLLSPLEMKPRVRFLRDELKKQLPEDYTKAVRILVQSAKSGKLDGFDLWPLTEFIQTYGLDHLDLSLQALKELTKVFTSEWAVRPFIKRHPRQTLRYLLQCAQNNDVHVRRWASEGTRPRLPWGERLQDFVRDPSPTLPILEKLKFDEELYVRKSVANHLNDIAKDHPDLVVKILTKWKKQAGSKHSAKIEWIIRRALRTLIKDGNSGALQLIGVSKKTDIQFIGFKIRQEKIKLGERIDFEFQIHSSSKKSQKLVVDYIVHFVRANQSTSPKVFKLKTVELPARGKISFAKSHHLKKVTTREYYPGLHYLEIQINGAVAGKKEWKLLSD
jgi:3-methyladenine DNA glycosylase AlkC